MSARQSGHDGVMGERRRTSRDGALDALRAFAACCVVLYHLSPSFVTYGSGGGDLSSAVEAVALLLRAMMASCVPIFFLVTGVLYAERSPSPKRCLRKAAKLLLLTLFWGVATWLVLAFEQGRDVSLGLCLSEVFQLKMGVLNHLWFLPALAICYMVLPVMCALRSDSPGVYRGVSIVILFSAFGFDLVNRVLTICGWRLDSALPLQFDSFLGNFDPLGGIYSFTIAYVVLGMHLGRSWRADYMRMATIGAVVGVLALAFYGEASMLVTGSDYDVTWNGYGFVGTACFTCFLYGAFKRTDWLADGGPLGRMVSWLGRHTLGIYLFHWVMLPLVRPFVFHFSGFTQVAVSLAVVAMIVVLSAGLSALMRRCAWSRALLSV